MTKTIYPDKDKLTKKSDHNKDNNKWHNNKNPHHRFEKSLTILMNMMMIGGGGDDQEVVARDAKLVLFTQVSSMLFYPVIIPINYSVLSRVSIKHHRITSDNLFYGII